MIVKKESTLRPLLEGAPLSQLVHQSLPCTLPQKYISDKLLFHTSWRDALTCWVSQLGFSGRHTDSLIKDVRR